MTTAPPLVTTRWMTRSDHPALRKLLGTARLAALLRAERAARCPGLYGPDSVTTLVSLVAERGFDAVHGVLAYRLHTTRLVVEHFGAADDEAAHGLLLALRRKVVLGRRRLAVLDCSDEPAALPLHLALRRAGFRARVLTADSYRFAAPGLCTC